MSSPLVIDDNRQTADALCQMLKLFGFVPRQALGPRVAMTVLATEIPTFITLDLNMPGVDGFEVLGYLKREPRLTAVPVIVITSDDQPETASRATKLGAGALIVKPVMPDVLEATLRRIGLMK
jgi:PleD family two-component response regulator